MNYTSGNICISFNDQFISDNGVKNYLELGKGCAYNALSTGNTRLYIKSENSGNIAIVVTD